MNERTKEIVMVSYKGILANILLVIFKTIVGIIANSISVILDAVNNLSDVLSSVITIIGTRIANKDADKKHPFGHGRVEYITSSLIAIIVLSAGFLSMKEAVSKIIHPSETKFSTVTIIVIIAGIITKYFLGKYFKKKGDELKSGALSASGADASFDAIISIGTLVSAMSSIFFKINIEGFLGAVISIFILKAGYEIMQDTLSNIIGVRIDDDLSIEVKNYVNSFPEVIGAYDLILHSYGPEELIGSIHIEVDDFLTAKDIDRLSRKIMIGAYNKLGVILTIGIYATNVKDEYSKSIKNSVYEEISKYNSILQMHGFYVEESEKLVHFDIIIDFDEKNQHGLVYRITENLNKVYPDIEFVINIDRDYSE
ncbi:cation diffusion facilitator family transporter [Peptostreptococcus sp. D1]|uniref:cation diffusion facilitator family transporter n=1 Tax=Peptostreptococcus sp. D1 TaxID=72304 RepID=UPI0008E63B31|nr:cation diffusion facilitator family transporter [Peptostreptococcus sp. D1]SFE66503.1 cation diffusion facilitator family transporter [Peptostreptococcus sp. D1]